MSCASISSSKEGTSLQPDSFSSPHPGSVRKGVTYTDIWGTQPTCSISILCPLSTYLLCKIHSLANSQTLGCIHQHCPPSNSQNQEKSLHIPRKRKCGLDKLGRDLSFKQTFKQGTIFYRTRADPQRYTCILQETCLDLFLLHSNSLKDTFITYIKSIKLFL